LIFGAERPNTTFLLSRVLDILLLSKLPLLLGALLKNVDVLILGCAVLPMNVPAWIKNGALAVKDGRLSFVGDVASVRRVKAEKTIKAKGMVALPGLVNCHTHVSMTLFRGLADDESLDVWLRERIWPFEAKLRLRDIEAGAGLGCLEMIKSGTTCFGDMYFHEDAVAEVVRRCGLRAVLAEGIVEAGDKAVGEKMLRRNVKFAEDFEGFADGRIKTMLAPHAAYSCSPDLLRRVSEAASKLGVGVHVHLAESKASFDECEKRYGVGEVKFLDGLGLLNDRVVAAHCVDLSGEDRLVLSKRGVKVVYVPVSNMKLGLGAARVKDLVDLGVNVGLGTDGAASNNSLDMFETMKFGALVQKLVYGDTSVFSAYEVLRMATVGGARVLGLEKDVGTLEVGKRADLILVDFSKPHLQPLHNLYSSLVYSAHGGDVDTVIVDGKVLMENRRVLTLNEQAVMEKADKSAADLLSR
jgi:5-methylthioadenosine/S-adenosylhomocysteine deaminase